VREDAERRARLEAEAAEGLRKREEEKVQRAERMRLEQQQKEYEAAAAEKARASREAAERSAPKSSNCPPVPQPLVRSSIVPSLMANADPPNDSGPGPFIDETHMSDTDVSFFGIDRSTFEALGGRKGLTAIAHSFYFDGMYKSPILGPLFHIKDSAHPEHLVMFMTHLMSVDNEYMRQRGSYFAVKLLHENARRDPIRNQCPPGGGKANGWWTCSQRDEWKRLFLETCVRHKVKDEVLVQLSKFLDRAMSFYGPFSADREV
jgi:hypothetical protein